MGDIKYPDIFVAPKSAELIKSIKALHTFSGKHAIPKHRKYRRQLWPVTTEIQFGVRHK